MGSPDPHPHVTINVEGPKDSPDNSLVSTPHEDDLQQQQSVNNTVILHEDINAPIDVSLSREASNVFYEYPAIINADVVLNITENDNDPNVQDSTAGNERDS